MAAASIPVMEGRNRARDLALEVRGVVRWLGEGSGLKNGGETAGATGGSELQRAAALLRLPASRGREKGEEGEAKRGFACDVVALLKW